MDISKIKKLRNETAAPVMECKKALEGAAGDMERAKKLLAKWGVERAVSKEGRKTEQGLVEAYVHTNGRAGVLVTLLCETDFVARTPEFKNLAHELALQVTAMKPRDVKELLKQEYIRDPKITVGELIKQTAGKVGENIRVKEFSGQEV